MPYKSIISGYFSLIINIILQLGDPRTILMTYQQKKTRLTRFEHTIWRLTDILTTKLNTPACDNLLLGVSIIDLNRIRVQGIIHGFNTKFTNFMLDFMPFFTYFYAYLWFWNGFYAIRVRTRKIHWVQIKYLSSLKASNTMLRGKMIC